MQIHATCVARYRRGILLLGPSGAGKSDLALRLIGIGFVLVADDQVAVLDGMAAPAEGLAGLMEVRGLGIVRLPHEAPVALALVLELGTVPGRHPKPAVHSVLGLPMMALDGHAASAAEKAALALDCVLGRAVCLSGALTP